ncbi:methyltransferase domain-containing protein [Mesonia ostreae]|uniref:Methyltransferase domain-containing protein n=1 Tax=Mesonia ostreae TaxID=861110 RepID=A0ABU2KHS4_9FLAO|nr:methyltransferase domain-containing protein [Mesonia ostreae]MDT0294255.1 methyltransferase domain-containing protein [Mesonia ostreae]
MKKLNTKERSKEVEIMDDFDLKGKQLERTLRDLEHINAWLGGNQITIQGLAKHLKNQPKDKEISIADIGCGNGAMLREIAVWAKKNKYRLKLIGVDANTHGIEIADKLAKNFPEIEFLALNLFSEDFKQIKFDVILCTLTLHHFKNEEIINILKLYTQQARLGVIVNDLQRSKIAYRLFKAFCGIFINNEIARKDGLISILRGFKKEELIAFSKQLPAQKHSINWKWAFRYQWIIQN